MASWKGSSKRKGWWEENVENEDKSAKRPKNLDEENCSNSSNSEHPEIEIDEISWNKIMSDNDESHVSEPWAGGTLSNQVGTSLRGGYNLPPALNEIGLTLNIVCDKSKRKQIPTVPICSTGLEHAYVNIYTGGDNYVSNTIFPPKTR